jgi:hypothetical protein
VLELVCGLVDLNLEYPVVITVLEFGEFLDNRLEVSSEILHSIVACSSGVIKEVCDLAQRERVIGELCCQQRMDVAMPERSDWNKLADQLLLALSWWSIFRELVVLNCGVIMREVNGRKTVKASFSELDVDVSCA